MIIYDKFSARVPIDWPRRAIYHVTLHFFSTNVEQGLRDRERLIEEELHAGRPTVFVIDNQGLRIAPRTRYPSFVLLLENAEAPQHFPSGRILRGFANHIETVNYLIELFATLPPATNDRLLLAVFLGGTNGPRTIDVPVTVAHTTLGDSDYLPLQISFLKKSSSTDSVTFYAPGVRTKINSDKHCYVPTRDATLSVSVDGTATVVLHLLLR